MKLSVLINLYGNKSLDETLKIMAEQGVTTFIETGVGNTLQKLVEKIVPDAKAYAVETKEQLDKVLAELGK